MDWSALTSTFLAVTFIQSGFDEISDSSLRHHPSKSKFLLKFGSPCQGVKVRVLEGAAFQPVSWITHDEGIAEKEAIAKTENSSPWWFLKGRGQMLERKRWLAEHCLWFAQCGVNLDCVKQLHPGCKGTAALGHTTWDRLPQTQAPPRVWCGLPHFSPYSSSGPKLCTSTVKSLISLLRKYCKTLCFSCLNFFSLSFLTK